MFYFSQHSARLKHLIYLIYDNSLCASKLTISGFKSFIRMAFVTIDLLEPIEHFYKKEPVKFATV